jgi:hypothetical protein
VGRFYKHDSPYTYFTSNELHLGEISLECSRAGAAAVALWATQRLLPLVPGGEFAHGLALGHRAALQLDSRLRADPRFVPFAAGRPQLDIVVWQARGTSPRLSSILAQEIFDRSAALNLHLALVQLPTAVFSQPFDLPETSERESTVTCLRSVLMKPEHDRWLDAIWERLSLATDQARGAGTGAGRQTPIYSQI